MLLLLLPLLVVVFVAPVSDETCVAIFFQGLVRVCLFSYSPAESTRRIFHELRRSSTGKAYRRSFSGVGGLTGKLPGTLIFGGTDF